MTQSLTFDDARYIHQAIVDLDQGQVIDYSGRFMYGKHCFAVDVANPASFLTAFMFNLTNDAYGTASVLAESGDVRIDNLGRGWVIYWPDIDLPEGIRLSVFGADE